MKSSKGKVWIAHTNQQGDGVRNENGFICFLPKPTHYQGQAQRYDDEMDEYGSNSQLIKQVVNVENETTCTRNVNAFFGY